MIADPDRRRHRGRPRRRWRGIAEVAVVVVLVVTWLVVGAVVRDESERLISRLPTPVGVAALSTVAVGYTVVLVRRRRRRSRLARGATS